MRKFLDNIEYKTAIYQREFNQNVLKFYLNKENAFLVYAKTNTSIKN